MLQLGNIRYETVPEPTVVLYYLSSYWSVFQAGNTAYCTLDETNTRLHPAHNQPIQLRRNYASAGIQLITVSCVQRTQRPDGASLSSTVYSKKD